MMQEDDRTTRSPVLTKADFVRRYHAGEFGNRPPEWLTLDEVLASGYRDPVHIRNRVAGGPTWYDVEAADLTDVVGELVRSGAASESSLYYAAMGRDEWRTLQGYTVQGLRGLDLWYTLTQKPLRTALSEESYNVSGVCATVLLRAYLCPNSLEWLDHLIKEYPGHAVEFTVWDRNWGLLPNFNTMFWEVRAY